MSFIFLCAVIVSFLKWWNFAKNKNTILRCTISKCTSYTKITWEIEKIPPIRSINSMISNWDYFLYFNTNFVLLSKIETSWVNYTSESVIGDYNKPIIYSFLVYFTKSLKQKLVNYINLKSIKTSFLCYLYSNTETFSYWTCFIYI